ncbi:hypothetical protein AB0K12_20280 [Nonomuraea sp. NPDC049419]|uniref:hypothetical protein n=1 Tax=Nonomuraea sp. NPDC049419 TaxID=3155772 RepID=UPI00342F81C2
MRDFYATVAQVLPVVLLAFVWDSKYFDGLSERQRNVRFWTLERVRIYALSVATVIIADLAVCLLVLAGTVPDSAGLRGVVIAGVALGLVSLLYRILATIITNTRPVDREG